MREPGNWPLTVVASVFVASRLAPAVMLAVEEAAEAAEAAELSAVHASSWLSSPSMPILVHCVTDIKRFVPVYSGNLLRGQRAAKVETSTQRTCFSLSARSSLDMSTFDVVNSAMRVLSRGSERLGAIARPQHNPIPRGPPATYGRSSIFEHHLRGGNASPIGVFKYDLSFGDSLKFG